MSCVDRCLSFELLKLIEVDFFISRFYDEHVHLEF